MSILLQRLNDRGKTKDRTIFHYGGPWIQKDAPGDPLCAEAAAEIQRLRARVAELEARAPGVPAELLARLPDDTTLAQYWCLTSDEREALREALRILRSQPAAAP